MPSCSICLFWAISLELSEPYLYDAFVLRLGFLLSKTKLFHWDTTIISLTMSSQFWLRNMYSEYKNYRGDIFWAIAQMITQLHKFILLLFSGWDIPLSKSIYLVNIHLILQKLWPLNVITQKTLKLWKL